MAGKLKFNVENDLLPALDFNAVNCGDVGARVFFGQSASAIRVLQGEVDYWRGQEAIMSARVIQLRRQMRELEAQLSLLTNGGDHG